MSSPEAPATAVTDEDYLVSLSPLDFELWDEQQKPAIYVEGGELSHKLTLATWNQDSNKWPIVLESDSARPSLPYHDFFASHHHLELRFPRGTLSEKARAWVNGDLDRLLASKEALGEEVWYIFYHEHSEKKFESLYLLFPMGKTLEAAGVATEKPALEIVLPHIAVDAGNDALVLPVELRPGPLAKSGPDSNELLGARICTVEVLSQLGQKYIPLHFDIVGSNTVLNDGASKTALLLRITNVDREVSIPIERKGNRQTRFILACEIADRGGHQEWALTDEKKKVTVQTQEVAGVGTIQPIPEKSDDWQSDPVTASTNGRMAEWVVDGESLGTDMLEPNDSVYLRLEVQTGLRSGPTDVHLYYRHIAGYWDGSRACTIQKSPLIFHRAGEKREYLGIGLVEALASLHVKQKYPADNAAMFEGGTGVAISTSTAGSSSLTVENTGSGRALEVRQKGSNDAWAAFFEGGTVGIGCVRGNSSALFLYDNDTDQPTLSVQNRGSGSAMQVQNSGTGLAAHFQGRVLIGAGQSTPATDPDVALQVHGRIWDKTGEVMPVGTILAYAGPEGKPVYSFATAARQGPAGWLMCNGGYAERTKYLDLYEVLKTNENTTDPNGGNPAWFRLPDLRGRIPVGLNSGKFKKLGEIGGSETHTLVESEMPPHKHDVKDKGHFHTIQRGDSSGSHSVDDAGGNEPSQNTGTTKADIEESSKGGGGAHNNLQPYLVVNYIIKY